MLDHLRTMLEKSVYNLFRQRYLSKATSIHCPSSSSDVMPLRQPCESCAIGVIPLRELSALHQWQYTSPSEHCLRVALGIVCHSGLDNNRRIRYNVVDCNIHACHETSELPVVLVAYCQSPSQNIQLYQLHITRCSFFYKMTRARTRARKSISGFETVLLYL